MNSDPAPKLVPGRFIRCQVLRLPWCQGLSDSEISIVSHVLSILLQRPLSKTFHYDIVKPQRQTMMKIPCI